MVVLVELLMVATVEADAEGWGAEGDVTAEEMGGLASMRGRDSILDASSLMYCENRSILLHIISMFVRRLSSSSNTTNMLFVRKRSISERMTVMLDNRTRRRVEDVGAIKLERPSLNINTDSMRI